MGRKRLRKNTRPTPKLTCGECGEQYLPWRGTEHFCSECYRKLIHRFRMQEWRASRKGDPKPRHCAHCGADITHMRADARFCSVKCRVYWNRGRN